MTIPLRSAAALLVLTAMIGCGGGGSKDLQIAGRVTFKGEPLVRGTVIFFYPDNVVAEGAISPDGYYLVLNGKPGKPKITVVSEKPTPPSPAAAGSRGAAKAGPRPDPAKWVAIPDKYAKLETTPLELTVSSTLDIKLEP